MHRPSSSPPPNGALLVPRRAPAAAQALALALASVLALDLALASPAPAATITIVNMDSAGVGLNDTTAATPVGGNPGTTRGAQALLVFQKAARIWGEKLVSGVEIKVDSRFARLTCTAGGGTLGSAAPGSFWLNFTNAPFADTIYPQALASALFGADIDPARNDISMQFNGAIGSADCLAGLSWYMGFDTDAPAGAVSLLSVTLHEMAHGLGFVSLVSPTTGSKAGGLDDAFMRGLENHAQAKQFPALSDAQRLAAITSVTGLHWTGTAALSVNDLLSAGTSGGHLLMYAPSTAVAGSSVSHFDKTLTPSDVMEPSYTTVNLDVTRALLLLKDVGWNTCGNGSLEFGEDCDDGNTADGDCCTSACVLAGPDGSPCDDGDECTTGDQCGDGACIGEPSLEGACAPTTTVTTTTTTTTTLPPFACGDANEDGSITSSDALRALRAAVGSGQCALSLCDYNGDGKLSAGDALAILRVAVGQPVTAKCPA